MKFYIFLGVLILLAVQLGVADSEKEVFNTWVTSGRYNTTDGYEFVVVVNEGTNKTFVNFENTSFIIKNGSCASEGGMVACINGIRATDEFNKELFKWVYEARLRIARKIPDVYIKTNYMKTSLLLKEETSLIIEFGNDGDKPATGVHMVYSYPEQYFAIQSVDGCGQDGNTIIWTGTLNPSDSRKCTARLVASSIGEGHAIAELTYFDGFRTQRSDTNSLVKVLGYVVTSAAKLGAEKLNVGNTTSFNVSFNPAQSLKAFQYTVEFPEGVEVISKPDSFRLVDGKYIYQKIIEGPESHGFNLRMNYLGNYSIISNISYQVEDFTHDYSFESNLSVKGAELAIKQLSNTSLDGIGKFYIINPSQTTFTDLEVAYPLNGEIHKQLYDSIGKMRNIEVKFNYSGNASAVTVPVELSYKSLAGQTLNKSAALSFSVERTVNPVPIIEKKNASVQEDEQNKLPSKNKGTLIGMLIGLALIVLIISFLVFKAVVNRERFKKEKPPTFDNEI